VNWDKMKAKDDSFVNRTILRYNQEASRRNCLCSFIFSKALAEELICFLNGPSMAVDG
jgi:hypothetical protein